MRTIGWLLLCGTLLGTALPGVAQTLMPQWQVRVIRPEKPFEHPQSVAVANDGTVALAGGPEPGHLYLLDSATGRIRWRYRGPTERGYLRHLGNVALSADARRVLSTHYKGIPNSEHWPVGVTVLDGGGRVLWGHAIGEAAMSPDGRHVTPWTYHTSYLSRLAVYNGTTGGPIWSVPPSAMGRVADATFSPDGRCLLATTVWRHPLPGSASHRYTQPWHSLWSADGEPLWIMESSGEVAPPLGTSLATSRDGSTSAILDGAGASHPATLTLLNRSGGLLGRWALDSGADPDGIMWETVSLAPDGRTVFLRGRMLQTARAFVRACDTSGRVLWETALTDRTDRPSVAFVLLPDAALRLGFEPANEAILLDGAGRIVRKTSVPNAHRWAISPNGRFLAAASRGGAVSLFALPGDLSADAPSGGVEGHLEPSGEAVWAWVPVGRALEGAGWSVRYNASAKETVAERAGQTVALRVGRWHASVNGRDVPLPGPVLLIRGRTMVPDTLRTTLAGAPPAWEWVSLRETLGDGWTLRYDPRFEAVEATTGPGGRVLRVLAGHRQASLRTGQAETEMIALPASPHIEDGRMMAPSTLFDLVRNVAGR